MAPPFNTKIMDEKRESLLFKIVIAVVIICGSLLILEEIFDGIAMAIIEAVFP